MSLSDAQMAAALFALPFLSLTFVFLAATAAFAVFDKDNFND